MKALSYFLLVAILVIAISCKKDTEDNNNNPNIPDPPDTNQVLNFTGKVQKGPYIAGTTVNLYELNTSLGQTGMSFTSTVTADDGSFTFGNLELNSDFGLLKANGFFFSETYGKTTNTALSLQALSDLSNRDLVNINVLTHIIKGRIETLVSEGLSFGDAYVQAKTELLAFLGVTDSFNSDFESLDISESNDANAVLLAFSIILQRYSTNMNTFDGLVAELSYLLTRLSTDFTPDGQISEEDLLDTLRYNISLINLIDIRENLEERYAFIGQNVEIPDFEKYIGAFQEKHSTHLYDDFYFPPESSPEPEYYPNSTVPNILVIADTVFQAIGFPYTIAAITPLYSSLKIEFKSNNPAIIGIGGGIHGWKYANNPDGFTLSSQRQNELMTMHLYFYQAGVATIHYYENGDESPTYSKQIYW